MKIYIVVADNSQAYEDHDNWNVATFASKEAAQKFIEDFPNEIAEAERRSDELDRLADIRELTPEEEEEYEQVYDLSCMYWHFFDYGRFRIEEYELQY